MKHFSSFLKAFILNVGVLSASLAGATIYSNSSSGTLSPFGAPDTTSYGEIFNLSVVSVVNGFTFFANDGTAGNLMLSIAVWDGFQAVGPAAYISPYFAYAGGSQSLSFSGINTTLNAGSYIAYITVAGVSDPATNISMNASAGDGGLGGMFAFLDSGGADPLTMNWPWWTNWSPSNLQYVADINAAPEPGSALLIALGLGLLFAATTSRSVAS